MAESAIARVERDLAVALGVWGMSSTVTGAALALAATSPQVRAFGTQTAVWGIIDTAIAAMAQLRARSPRRPDPATRTRSLKRTLAINTVLDLGYVAGGIVLIRRAGRIAESLPLRGRRAATELRGDGAAVVAQGGFLLLLDSFHLFRLRTDTTRG